MTTPSVDGTQPQGTPDTHPEIHSTDQAVQQWLSKHPDVDLSNLTPDQLQNLIHFLSGLKNESWAHNSNLRNIIHTLQAELNNLKSAQHMSPLESLKVKLRANMDIADALGVSNSPAHSVAHVQQLSALEKMITALHTPTTGLGSDQNSGVIQQTNDLLQKLGDLERSGINLHDVGLDGLKRDLQAAKAQYEQDLKDNPSPEGRELALSKFAQSVAQAKLTYLKAQGLPDSDSSVTAERNVIAQESTRQANITATWTEPEQPQPGDGATMDTLNGDLAQAQSDLDYVMTNPDADATIQNIKILHAQAKVDAIKKCISDLKNGVDAFSVVCEERLGLLQADVDMKTGMADYVANQGPDGQDQATELRSDAAKIQKCIDALTKAMAAIYDAIARYNDAAYNV